MYSGTATSFRQTEDQQTKMRSLLDRPRCRRRSPAPHCRFPVNFWTLLIRGLQRVDNDIHVFDILPLAAAVCRLIETDPGWASEPRYPRPLPELLAAIAGLLARRQPHNAPKLRTAWTIQQVTRAEFHILEVLNYELGTLTPAAWIDIFGRRLSLWEQQQLLLPQQPNLPAAPTVLVDCAHLIAEGHVQAYSFCANSRASQVGASAWFISVAFWVCLSLIAAHCQCRYPR